MPSPFLAAGGKIAAAAAYIFVLDIYCVMIINLLQLLVFTC